MTGIIMTLTDVERRKRTVIFNNGKRVELHGVIGAPHLLQITNIVMRDGEEALLTGAELRAIVEDVERVWYDGELKE